MSRRGEQIKLFKMAISLEKKCFWCLCSFNEELIVGFFSQILSRRKQNPSEVQKEVKSKTRSTFLGGHMQMSSLCKRSFGGGLGGRQ